MEKIGRYEIVSELGRGAMGLVYRAIDPNIGRTVALKTMRLDVHGMDHDEMLRRFKNEARAAGLMNHPNIVTIYDADEVDGLFYIAMEYLEGQTLQSLMIEKRIIPADQIVDIAKQVCAGLEYASRMKVIHRDIKPANIMITPHNVAKIMDFGISKSVGSMTSSGQVLGTPNYMAPEQVKGFDLDGRADLFSFGVVLYEMATGERPFSGQNVTTIIYKIVNEYPIPPCELEMTVHPGLSWAVLKCLAKDPNERYQTASALAHDIENYRSIGTEGDITSVIPDEVTAAATQPQTYPSGAWRTASMRAQREGAAGNGTGAAAAVASAKIPQTAKPVTATVKPPTVAFGQTARKRASTIALCAMAIIIAVASLYAVKHRQRQRAIGAQAPAVVAQVQAQPQSVPVPVSPPAADKQPDSKEPKIVAKKSGSPVEAKPRQTAIGGKVEIRFTSHPEGAFVQIDGRSSDAWITPFTMPDVSSGSHEVHFTKQGYAPETRELEVGPKNASYTLDLVPVTTALSIFSDPPGASIEVDGKDTTKVTPAQIPVAEGQHKVIVRLDGYRWQEATANVAKGQVFVFSPKLNPGDARQAGNTNPVTTRLRKFFGAGGSKGVIDFVTDPPGAKIFVQGRAAAIATPAHAPFPPGDYQIELREPGYKPVQRIVHVEAGQIVKVNATLEPK